MKGQKRGSTFCFILSAIYIKSYGEKFADLQTGTPDKFADLRTNKKICFFQICDLRTDTP
jgi:hypothetical protein